MAGREIVCPVCAMRVNVPLVKTASIHGGARDPATKVARDKRLVRHLTVEVRALNHALETLVASAPELDEELDRMSHRARLMRERVELLGERLARSPVAPSPAEAPEMVTPPPSSGFRLTDGKLPWLLAALALFLALLAVFL